LTYSDAAGRRADYHHTSPSQPPSFPQPSGPMISGPGGGYYQSNLGIEGNCSHSLQTDLSLHNDNTWSPVTV